MNKIEKLKAWYDNSWQKAEGYGIYTFYDDSCPDPEVAYEDKDNGIYVFSSDLWAVIFIDGIYSNKDYKLFESVFYPGKSTKIEIKKEVKVKTYSALRLEDGKPVSGYYIMNKVRPQPEFDLYDSNQVHHYIETEYGDRYEIDMSTLTEVKG